MKSRSYTLWAGRRGQEVGDICARWAYRNKPFTGCKKRYAGVGVSELRQLRDENRKLETLVADLTLDKHILQ